MAKRRVLWLMGGVLVLTASALALRAAFKAPRREVILHTASPEASRLEAHCREVVGDPRVVAVGDRVRVAVGYDLANVITVRTDDGDVVIDTGMSPGRAREIRAALGELRVRAVVLTHSHIDHVGGASVFADPGAEIWATAAFTAHFFKQYGMFREAERRRGEAQFGRHVSPTALPCAAIGRRPDFEAAMTTGARLPTRTFEGATRFAVGGVTFDLVEAPGETHDQLFVFLPELDVLLPGDNWYAAFPNLYTIRGTAARPVDGWIESLDAMRRRAPAHLVPSHGPPLSGREAIQAALRDYRDGIQWVRDRAVRGAARGLDTDTLAATTKLPAHLGALAGLQPLYGDVGWSARAIYDQHLGWFDERPERLLPLPPDEQARRTVEAMGGASAVRAAATRADDPRWAAHLHALLRDAGAPDAEGEAAALVALAGGTANANARGYLLESAWRLRNPAPEAEPRPTLDDALIDALPIASIFRALAPRLAPERSIEAFEAVRFELGSEVWHVTVRRGVAEVVAGEALPGTPAPLATVRAAPGVWRRIAVGATAPAAALAAGDLDVTGDFAAFVRFFDRFER